MTLSYGPLRVNPSDPRPLYVQIVDEVRRAVSCGLLPPGDSLPSVRELAGALRINPNTVLQAYRELEREGVVEVRRGQGTFVAPGVRSSEVSREVARELAHRCLREAARAGLSPDAFMEALHEALPPTPDPAPAPNPDSDDAS